MEEIDKKEFIRMSSEIELSKAREKVPYRISLGQTLLDNEELGQKWANFVNESTEGIGHGLLLDETLQIMGLIKAGTSYAEIREVLSKINGSGTVIDYLSAFIHPEIISMIDLNNKLGVDINQCDLNEDYFHFTNRENVNSILINGLIPQVGVASQLVGDRPNVSISKGGKGIMGIITSFLFKFENEMQISDIPQEYRKYFPEITDFSQERPISKALACRAMQRKLNDEVYFRVIPTNEQLERAKIGGVTGYDVNLSDAISRDQVSIVTGPDNRVISALDVARFVFERAKDIAIIREMHPNFFEMFELEEAKLQSEQGVTR